MLQYGVYVCFGKVFAYANVLACSLPKPPPPSDTSLNVDDAVQRSNAYWLKKKRALTGKKVTVEKNSMKSKDFARSGHISMFFALSLA